MSRRNGCKKSPQFVFTNFRLNSLEQGRVTGEKIERRAKPTTPWTQKPHTQSHSQPPPSFTSLCVPCAFVACDHLKSLHAYAPPSIPSPPQTPKRPPPTSSPPAAAAPKPIAAACSNTTTRSPPDTHVAASHLPAPLEHGIATYGQRVSRTLNFKSCALALI
jgi:hypothetical protein